MASLSGLFNLQSFTDLGAFAVGGRLYTYAPGTTTHKTAYTDAAAAVPHTYTSDGIGGQYIAMNARGELTAPLFLSSGGYDITYKTAAGVTVWTRRAAGDTDALYATVADLASTSDAAKGAGLIGFSHAHAYGSGTVGRKLKGLVSVKDLPYGAVGDGVTDDTAAIQACLDANDSIWFPPGTYKVSSTIRASRVVNIDGDPEASLVATSSFAGISITNIGVAFVLKAILAVFSGSDIGQQANPRLGESGDLVRIGPMRLVCGGYAQYGVLINSCPGAVVRSNVSGATEFGIWAGPNCWGASFQRNRITACVVGGIYIGEACNGASVSWPEIWGHTLTTGYGVYCDGTVAGVIGAVGNVHIHGGYIEDCTTGVYLKDTGSVNIDSVDIEGIAGNAVWADCSTGNTYGLVSVRGCALIALGAAVRNKNAYIVVRDCQVVDGATLEPYLADNNDSLFVVDGSRQFDSGGAPTAYPTLSTAPAIIAAYETKSDARILNKRVTDTGAAFSRSWAVFNLASNSQPEETTTAIECRSTAIGDANNSYRGTTVLRGSLTTSDPGARTLTTAAVHITHNASNVRVFHPESDGDHRCGDAAYRWSVVYASTGTINTSDRNQKQDIRELSAAELRVAKKLRGLIRAFRFNDSVAEKGSKARIHVGVIAQDVEQAFKSEGLDGFAYAVLCKDETEAGTRYGVRYEQLLAFCVASIDP